MIRPRGLSILILVLASVAGAQAPHSLGELFGLDKLHNIDRTVANLEAALDEVAEAS